MLLSESLGGRETESWEQHLGSMLRISCSLEVWPCSRPMTPWILVSLPENRALDSIITFSTGLMWSRIKSQMCIGNCDASMKVMIENMIMIRLERGQRQIRYPFFSLSFIHSRISFNNHMLKLLIFLYFPSFFVFHWQNEVPQRQEIFCPRCLEGFPASIRSTIDT